MKEIKVLSPTAILGYGFPIASFEKAMAMKPDVIAVDAGSTDPGPYYLGAGKSFTDRMAVKRDLSIMIDASLKNNIPLLIGSAGGSGGNIHLKWCVDIVSEIIGENSTAKVAVISAEVNKSHVLNEFYKKGITPLNNVPEVTKDDIEKSTRIVAQMGLLPFFEALDEKADIIIAGRTYDPVVFAAYAIKKGYDIGLALHMGKILECACIAATPGSGSDCMMGCIGKDYFKVFPLNEARKCTTLSVAAHTLYEKSNPYILHGPDGIIDLTKCSFEQFDNNTVKVSGTKFIPSKIPMVKLEGAKISGYRTISIAGIRDKILIDQLDDVLEKVKQMTSTNFKKHITDYFIDFRIYGKNGVMGDNEPVKHTTSHELGLIIDVVSASQDDSNTICSFVRSSLLHYGYKGRISTAGNLAFPYSPSDFKAGEVYEFCLYHLIKYQDNMFNTTWLGENYEN